MTLVSWPTCNEGAKTDVGRVLSVYIVALMPAIKIASRPSQPAASNTVLSHAVGAAKYIPNPHLRKLSLPTTNEPVIVARADSTYEHNKI